jgi:hypothetical protein
MYRSPRFEDPGYGVNKIALCRIVLDYMYPMPVTALVPLLFS